MNLMNLRWLFQKDMGGRELGERASLEPPANSRMIQ